MVERAAEFQRKRIIQFNTLSGSVARSPPSNEQAALESPSPYKIFPQVPRLKPHRTAQRAGLAARRNPASNRRIELISSMAKLRLGSQLDDLSENVSLSMITLKR